MEVRYQLRYSPAARLTPGNQGILANADAGREIGTNRAAHTSSGRPAGA